MLEYTLRFLGRNQYKRLGVKSLFKHIKALKNRVSVKSEKFGFNASFLTFAVVGEKYGLKKTKNTD